MTNSYQGTHAHLPPDYYPTPHPTTSEEFQTQFSEGSSIPSRRDHQPYIFTGRNEVLAKVIFSEACVILSTGGVGGCLLQIWGGVVSAPNFRGGGVCSKFSGGRVSAPNFRGGVCSKFQGGSAPNFGGVCSKFSGGCLLQIFGGGVSNFRNTVNVRPVRILLECILVC